MQTTARARKAEVVSRSRAFWARAGGGRRRYSSARVRQALKQWRCDGWAFVVPGGGGPGERITAISRNHPMTPLALEYAAGVRLFDRARLQKALGKELDSRAGADALAAVGFALVGATDSRVKISASDPRLARLVNRARVGPQYRSYQAHTVVAAVLHLPRQEGRRCVVTESRRKIVATLLEEVWAVSCEQLRNGEPRVRLCSLWALGPLGAKSRPQVERRE